MDTNRVNLSIIVPALNEQDLIMETYSEIISATSALNNYEIIFVNDNSSDNTPQIMEEIASNNKYVRVIHNKKNLGLGGSYKAGVELSELEYVIMVPGDNNFSSFTLSKLFSRIGDADIIVPFHGNTDMVRSVFRRFVSDLFTRLLNFAAKSDLKYYNSIVIHKAEILKGIPRIRDDFAYQADILIKLLQRGCTYEMVEITLDERKTGETKAFKAKNVVKVSLFLISLLYKRIINN